MKEKGGICMYFFGFSLNRAGTRYRNEFLRLGSVISLIVGFAQFSAAQWTQLSPGSGPDPRIDSTAVRDAGSNSVILFGGNDTGCTFSNSLNDTWLLANADGLGASPKWSKISPSGAPPAGRRGQSAVYDSSTDRMIVFGGDPVGCAVDKYNDVWLLLDATGKHGGPTWEQLSPTGSLPPARSDHSAVYDAVNNRMTVAGGFGPDGDLNDVWVLENANGLGGSPVWTQLTPSGGPPSANGLRAVTYDPASNRMTVFGGWNCCSGPDYNDTWILTDANGVAGISQWIRLNPSGTLPSPRAGSQPVYNPRTNKLTVFGGDTSSGQVNELWVLSFANGLGGTPAWTELHPTGALPAPRGGPAADPAIAYDAGFGRMIIFGGSGPSGLLNDVWVFAGLP
ncbi:MAG: kelch repeat-containing protein [Bryobacteraceae bacterium]